MRFLVITLVSLLGYSLGDILQVKCGDELCEKPTNLASTTLRYIPDRPYKLQIFALNAEVEIFGETDQLFYAKYGRNYGFIPKNHLREKSRGNFQHAVEINFDNIKLNHELKMSNYLHEIVKSSLSGATNNNEIINETNSDVKENTIPVKPEQPEKEEEKKVEAPSSEEERAKEYIPIGTEPTIPEQAEEIKTENVVDDSKKIDQVVSTDDTKKVDEVQQDSNKLSEEVKTNEVKTDDPSDEAENDSGIEEEEDDEDEDDEFEEEDEPEFIDSKQEKNETATVAPMAELKEETTEKPVIENVEEKQPDIAANAEAVEEIKIVDDKPIEDIKIHENQATQTNELNQFENIIEQAPTIEAIEPQKIDEKPLELPTETIPEVTPEASKDPAPVIEEIIEEEPIVTTEQPKEVKFEPEIPPPLVETTTQSYEPPITESPEITTEVPPSSSSQEKREFKVDQDLLLKRFNEKLGHKHSDGIGSIEQIHKDHGHSHEHHSHEHLNIPHQHEHTQNTQQNEIKSDSEEELVQSVDEDDKKPGFFSGLVKKIFGDEHEKHSHEPIENADIKPKPTDEGFCEKIDSENCPKSLKKDVRHDYNFESSNTIDEYFKMMLSEAVEMMDVIITMSLVALTVLIFIFGHYCISKASKEGDLIRKMNALERELMASTKENGTLKTEVDTSKNQLKSIQDNSFGSNDMVIALKHDLELSEREKEELLEKVAALEKELEAAAEDGLELNKMVSELLSNQTGSDSIISSVEDLQKQLNEQQETIVTMNEALAAKSRENSELQIQLSEINGKFSGEFEKFQQQLDAITLERSNLQIELENLKRESDVQINQIIEERNSEVTRLNNELTSYAGKYDESKKLLTAAESRVQALEECVDTIKKGKNGGDVKKLLDVADLKADLLAVTKEKSTIQEQLQNERDSRKLLEDRVKAVSDEMSSLKKEFSIAEKEKLDAQTRLDVLSNYFKEKETQLQQELSVKEARWMQQQGETTSTVEKVQALNAEIQTLKSQNDELKAEFEAQIISYKTKLSSVEAQSHSAWLAAKQAERKLEESRMEAATLRRRLTSIAENPSGAGAELLNGLPGAPNDSMNSMSSPMRVESPNNISLPPPPLMMPPFLPGAPPFLPPPFMPGEMPHMGLPPLGRLMSPPPKRFTPTNDRDRYSPRGRYSPDSRYDDYTPFETETDISPPRSPVPRRGYSSPSDRNKKSKGGHNLDQPSRRK